MRTLKVFWDPGVQTNNWRKFFLKPCVTNLPIITWLFRIHPGFVARWVPSVDKKNLSRNSGRLHLLAQNQNTAQANYMFPYLRNVFFISRSIGDLVFEWRHLTGCPQQVKLFLMTGIFLPLHADSLIKSAKQFRWGIAINRRFPERRRSQVKNWRIMWKLK